MSRSLNCITGAVRGEELKNKIAKFLKQAPFTVFASTGFSLTWFASTLTFHLAIVTLAGCSARCVVEPTQLSTVSEMRQLPFLQDVECRRLRQSQVNGYLRRSIRERNDPQRIHVEGRMLKLLGLLPADYPYPEGVVQQYGNDLLAMYSTDEKRIIFVNRRTVQRTVAVDSSQSILQHELIHALQDQHYDLQALIDPTLTNDMLLARMSLLEGDANWVTRVRQRSVNDHCDASATAELLYSLSGIADGTDGTPRILRIMMEFPYVFGERLACMLTSNGTTSRLNDAYKYPPKMTSELLFPDRYLTRLAEELRNKSTVLEAGDFEAEDLSWRPQICVGDYPFVDRLGALIGAAYVSQADTDRATMHEIVSMIRNWRSDQIQYDPGMDSICWEIGFADVASALRFAERIRRIAAPTPAKEVFIYGRRVIGRSDQTGAPGSVLGLLTGSHSEGPEH